MRRAGLALFLVLGSMLLAASRPALGQGLNLSGLAAAADAYAAALQHAVPAGMNAAARTRIEQRVAQGIAAGDWVHAVLLLKYRLGAGDTTSALWLALAAGLEQMPPPDQPRAPAAAWNAYRDTNPRPDQLPALRIMLDALTAGPQRTASAPPHWQCADCFHAGAA